MGGTFDPIHYGHLVAAEAARTEFDLEVVVFVPSGHPPHKKDSRLTPARHRYLMTVLAVATNPWFEVSRVEIEREGYSYTIDTVKAFRERYGPATELYFITGADAILEILTWHRVNELLTMCRFIAATRPGYHLDGLGQVLQKLPPEGRGRIHLLEVPALAISSTDVRERVRCGRSIKYLLPEAVEHYIYKNHLYVSDAEAEGVEEA
ncbi:MAG: nicotinate-nucleotide adenylyltransferase [Clostridia bacterium]|nr:nicotinate-nucleotide adenylyltransferase [Clostridia bacterium]